MAHITGINPGQAPASYEASIIQCFEDSEGKALLGSPAWTTTLDLTGSQTYNSSVDEEGFVEIGTVSLNLTEPELATVVIRLSSAGDYTEGTLAGSGYVLADAIKLVPEEIIE